MAQDEAGTRQDSDRFAAQRAHALARTLQLPIKVELMIDEKPWSEYAGPIGDLVVAEIETVDDPDLFDESGLDPFALASAKERLRERARARIEAELLPAIPVKTLRKMRTLQAAALGTEDRKMFKDDGKDAETVLVGIMHLVAAQVDSRFPSM